MEIYLVQPPVGGQREDVSPPLGIMALAATLEAEGHKPHLVDLNLASKTGGIDPRKNLRTQFVQSLPKRSSAIELLGVTTWSYNFDATMEFVEAVSKKHEHVPIVLGGPHVTFVDQEVMRAFESVDFCVRDEGDLTFPRLARAVEKGSDPRELALIPGLTWRKGTEIVRNPSGPVVEDLDGLPRPAYHLLDVRDYLACMPLLIVEAGRGCPYNCNFCSTTNMFQRKYRVKSATHLVDEMEWLVKTAGHSRLELLHDNLVASKAYVRELCQEIRRRCLDVSWSCTSRTDNMDEELAEEMFLAGCVSIFFGIESMDESRQRWTGKKLKPPLVEAAIALTAKHHVTPSVGIIVGFPEESASELDATVSAAVRWTTDPKIKATVSTAALRFYPGADLFGQAALLRYDETASRDNAVIPGLTLREEWRGMSRIFALNSAHTPNEETRRIITIRNFTRTLLKACPQTFHAVITLAGLGPHELFRRMIEGRTFRFLDEPSHDLTWNETLRAFADVVTATGNPHALELLACEVPFFRTTPITGPLERLEHVVHEKRFEHEALLAHAQGRGGPPATIEGTKILSIRGGKECVVWFTREAEKTLATFERAWLEDRKGTVAFLAGLRRGV